LDVVNRRRRLCIATFLAVLLGLSPAWSQITEDFDGTYAGGLLDGWITETDGWGDPPEPLEITPGRGDTGSAQALRTQNGTHYVVRTFDGLTTDVEYTVSVWIRTYSYNGDPTPPSTSWVEFGWDAFARNSTQPNSNLVWNVDPKFDYANNTGNWVQYAGEPFTARSDSVTIAFKVGTADGGGGLGVQAHFDDLEIVPQIVPQERFQFPDDFNTTYTAGVAYGWAKRFIPGGLNPRWEKGTGRTGSAQRLFAAPEGTTGLSVNIGVVKVFEVEPGGSHTINLWLNAADSFGSFLVDVIPAPADPGPIVKFGVDPSGQNDTSDATSVQWNESPTAHFSTEGNQGVWAWFESDEFRPTSNTVSVWLWVRGDDQVGVDARFDDLEIESLLDTRNWQLYR
jgi:hypothetical protein